MFYKFLISLMLGAVISLFFISKPDGQKILTTTVIQQDAIHAFEQIKSHITHLSLDTISNISAFTKTNDNTESVTLYQWQDKQGQWHFSNNEGNPSQTDNKINRQTITIIPNTPLIAPRKPAITTPTRNVEKAPQLEEKPSPTLPIANALNTLQDAQNIQALMDNHSQKLDNTIKNIGK